MVLFPLDPSLDHREILWLHFSPGSLAVKVQRLIPGSRVSSPSSRRSSNNGKEGKKGSLQRRDKCFKRLSFSPTVELMNDSLPAPSSSSSPSSSTQPMKISSTVQFRKPYKSILVSTHIFTVRGEFICLITEHRCQTPALLITVRYMNGGERLDSAGQKGGQSN